MAGWWSIEQKPISALLGAELLLSAVQQSGSWRNCTYTSLLPCSANGTVLPCLCKLAAEQEISYNRKQKNSEL